jgi:hypothetical protein
LQIDWTIVRLSDKVTILSTNPPVNTLGIRVASESLTIDKKILSTVGDDYDISCSANNKKYSGVAKKSFTTSLRLKNVQVQFSIFPTTGRAQDTVFSLSVKKPPG